MEQLKKPIEEANQRNLNIGMERISPAIVAFGEKQQFSGVSVYRPFLCSLWCSVSVGLIPLFPLLGKQRQIVVHCVTMTPDQCFQDGIDSTWSFGYFPGVHLFFLWVAKQYTTQNRKLHITSMYTTWMRAFVHLVPHQEHCFSMFFSIFQYTLE